MLKNMTRKGLALGTGLALVATGFVAAPAQATATGLLWSAYGQSNEMVGVAGHAFTLQFANPRGIYDDTNTEDFAPAVSATMVPNANVATIVPTKAAVTSFTKTSAADAIAVDIGVALDATTTDADDYVASGLIEIIPPSTLTHSIQVEVQVTYDDGQKSEVETITFVPADSVTACLSLDVIQEGDLAATGTFALAGINTQNFVTSNITLSADVSAGSPTVFGLELTGSLQSAPSTAKTFTTNFPAYDVVNDRYNLSWDIDAAQPEEVFTFEAIQGKATTVQNVNTYFDADSTSEASLAKVTRTLSANTGYAAMDISIGTSASIAHNNTGTATLVPVETVVALEGTKSLVFTISLFTDTTMVTRAGANHEVEITLRDSITAATDGNSLDTTTLTSEGTSLSKSGTTVKFVKKTNSSGQVSFTVAANNAVDGEGFQIEARGTIENASNTVIGIDKTTVLWQEAAWNVVPALADDFTIAPKGSLSVDYTVVDQFGNLANADYQLAFTRDRASGTRTVAAGTVANWSYVAPVSAAGKASVTIVDNGAASTEGKDTVTVTLQKKASAGGAYVNVTPAATDTFAITYENDLAALTSTAKVNYDGIANAAGTAVAPIYLETDPLVNFDSRISNDRTAVNKWEAFNYHVDGKDDSGDDIDGLLRVFGNVVTTNNAPVAGVAVKLSATGLNFADKSSAITRASNDSIVVFTDATGSYEAFVRSSVAGRQTISVDAQGAKSSVVVRFQESTGVATTLTLEGPASVTPGARADFVAKVVDKFGKPVSGVKVSFKDNGPGVLSATSADTDPFGDASVTLTTLAAESGTTTVTAWATIGGQTVSVTKTIAVGSGVAGAGKVNVGSFNGKLVVYASGLQGSTISWKVGGNWGKGVASSNYSIFNRPTPRAGVTVSVDIYVNGVKTLTKSVVTR